MPRERKGLKSKNSMVDGMDSGLKSKKRRSSLAVTAINTPPQDPNQMMGQSPRGPCSQGDLAPPLPSNAYDTLIAANPFDDTPRPLSTSSTNSQGPPPTFKNNSKGPQTPNPSPNQNQMNQRRPASVGHQPLGPNMPQQGKSLPIMSGKVYPADTPVVVNPQNRNQPPIYTCGVCHKEVNESDQAILCESGCNFWYHRVCTGLTEIAFKMLTEEVYAEWVCDNCSSTKDIPLVKFKP